MVVTGEERKKEDEKWGIPNFRDAIFFFGAQFSRELARLYEYSYRPCAVCLFSNFVLCCINRRLVREVSRERKQVRDQCGIE